MSAFAGFGVVRDVQDAVAFGGNDGLCIPAIQLGAQVVFDLYDAAVWSICVALEAAFAACQAARVYRISPGSA